MDERMAVVIRICRLSEKPNANHCFVTGRALRGAPHDPARYVWRGVPLSVNEDMWIEWTARAVNFVARNGVLTKKFSSLVRSTAYCQPEIDRLSSRLPVH